MKLKRAKFKLQKGNCDSGKYAPFRADSFDKVITTLVERKIEIDLGLGWRYTKCGYLITYDVPAEKVYFTKLL